MSIKWLAPGLIVCGCASAPPPEPVAPRVRSEATVTEEVVTAPAPPAHCAFGQVGRCTTLCFHRDGPSCNNLGAMAELGDGVPADRDRALELYAKACELGAEAGCRNRRRLQDSPVAVAKSPPPPPAASAAPAPARVCSTLQECKAKCEQGDEESCRELPGIHISGNVVIHGNVKLFGEVYLYGRHEKRK